MSAVECRQSENVGTRDPDFRKKRDGTRVTAIPGRDYHLKSVNSRSERQPHSGAGEAPLKACSVGVACGFFRVPATTSKTPSASSHASHAGTTFSHFASRRPGVPDAFYHGAFKPCSPRRSANQRFAVDGAATGSLSELTLSGTRFWAVVLVEGPERPDNRPVWAEETETREPKQHRTTMIR